MTPKMVTSLQNIHR